MKTNKILSIIVLAMFMLLSCESNAQDKKQNEKKTEVKTFNEKLDLSSMDLKINYKYKVKNIKERNTIVNLFTDEMYKMNKSSKDETLFGYYFDVKGNGDNVTVRPITNPPTNQTLASCPDGWKNEGWCMSSKCVAKKVNKVITAAIGDSEGDVSVRVIRGSTGVRVCSKTN